MKTCYKCGCQKDSSYFKEGDLYCNSCEQFQGSAGGCSMFIIIMLIFVALGWLNSRITKLEYQKTKVEISK